MIQRAVAGQVGREGPTPAIWIPTLWVALGSLRYSVEPGAPSVEYVTGHAFPTLFMLLLAAGFAVLLTRLGAATSLLAANPLIVSLYLFLAVSLVWAPFPWVSFRRWVKIVGALGMVLIVASEPRPLEAFLAMMRRYFALIVPLSLLLVFFLPSVGRQVFPDGAVTWVGVTPNRNYLGKVALLCAVTFTWDATRRARGVRRLRDGALSLVCLLVIVGCGSVTSLAIYVAAAAVLLAARAARRDVLHVGGILAYLVALGAVLYALADLVAGRTSVATGAVAALGRDATLTGRTVLWADLWEYVLQRPLFGHGYSGFWVWGVMERLWDRHRWLPTGGHNGYLDVVLDTGLVGLALFLAVVVRSGRKAMRLFDRHFEAGRLKLALLAAVLGHNLTESSFLKNDVNWVVLLFAMLDVPQLPREAPARAETAVGSPGSAGAARPAA